MPTGTGQERKDLLVEYLQRHMYTRLPWVNLNFQENEEAIVALLPGHRRRYPTHTVLPAFEISYRLLSGYLMS